MAPSSLLIAGAGDVGRRVAVRAAAAGSQVITLRRSATVDPDPRIEAMAADLTRPDTLTALAGAVTTAVVAVAPAERSVEAYRSVYLDGVANLVAAIGPSLQRLIVVTSTAVYGYDDGRRVDESSPVRPATPTAEVLVEAEEQARAIGPDATTIVRLAGIYGPGRTRLIDTVRAGTAELSDYFTNRIHADDAAGLLAAVATIDDPPAVLIGVDEAPVAQREVVSWLANRLGCPPPPESSESA
ncbi:MAG: NAD-dependent epimerase/dehydratase family protein, partial [Acidimicrobiales bacterium]|nr:NAD-dependent epimerase/dehydratase family protein [Acidimicrobiales bacterium]